MTDPSSADLLHGLVDAVGSAPVISAAIAVALAGIGWVIARRGRTDTTDED